MSVRQDNVNLVVTITGSDAKKELGDLNQVAATLTQQIKDLKKAGEDYTEQSQQLTAVRARMDDLKNSIGLTSLSQKELNQELSQLIAINRNLIPMSEGWKANATQIGAIKDRLAELNAAVPQTEQIINLSAERQVRDFARIGEGVVAAYSILPLIAFGNKSKESQEIMMKAQEAIAVILGIRRLAEAAVAAQQLVNLYLSRQRLAADLELATVQKTVAISTESNTVANVANAESSEAQIAANKTKVVSIESGIAATAEATTVNATNTESNEAQAVSSGEATDALAAKTVATEAGTIATVQGTTATEAFTAALNINPLVLVATAILAAAYAIGKLINSESAAEKAEAAMNVQLQQQNDLLQQQKEFTDQLNSAQLTRDDLQISIAEKQGESENQLYQMRLNKFADYKKSVIDQLQNLHSQEDDLWAQHANSTNAKQTEELNKQINSLQDQQTKLKDEQSTFDLQAQELQADHLQTLANQTKKFDAADLKEKKQNIDDDKKLDEERYAEEEALEELNNQYLISAKASRAKDLADAEDKYNKLAVAAKDNSDILQSVLISERQALANINAKWDETDAAEKKAADDKLIAQANDVAKKVVRIWNEELKTEKAIADAKAKLTEAEWNLAEKGISLLENIAGKKSAIGKAAFIAEKALAAAKVIIHAEEEIASLRATEAAQMLLASAVPGGPELVKALYQPQIITAIVNAASEVATIAGTAVSGFALGGIVNQPTPGIFGEDGPEALIPLGNDKRQRGMDLWIEAGKRMGAFTPNPSVVNVNGIVNNIRNTNSTGAPIASGNNTSGATDNSDLAEAIQRLNKNLENGIYSKFVFDEYVRDLNRVNNIQQAAGAPRTLKG
jgi:hypothetical protein